MTYARRRNVRSAKLRLWRLGPPTVAALSLLSPGCRPSAPVANGPSAKPSAGISFVDDTEAAGVRFQHTHGGSGRRLMPETVGAGCVWFDYDSDGWPDLLLVNSSPLPGASTATPPTAGLYHNRGDGTFEDKTAGSGLDAPMYGQGAAAADFDGDGDPDLLITCLGANRLFRNEGKGRFKDVTPGSGLADDAERWRWHTGAAWLDYDRDGRPDVFVARYVRWTPETDQFCGIPGGLKRYCPPWKYVGESCALYRNLGNGRFADVSKAVGVDAVVGKWFQPFVLDYNDDGWQDVVVVSDGTPTALFENTPGEGGRSRRFRDVGPDTGLGLSETGMPKGQMGIDAADWRNQGRESVLVGNFSGERLSLFEPQDGPLYTDVAGPMGMGESSLYSLTFGVAFLDADLDGWQDAFIGNGHIDDYIERFETGVLYRQRPLFYRNLAGARFEEMGLATGAALAQKLVARGCAVADYNRDGLPDVAVVQNNGPARLFRNTSKTAGNWLRVELRGTAGGTDALGAKVEVEAGGVRQSRRIRAGGLFLSQNELPALFGLGTAQTAKVTVTWPNGKRSVRENVAATEVVAMSEPGG
jgi:hypothetical protein